MTLIVGIICADGIVLAADSQTSKGDAKIPGTNKISEIDFLNGSAIIAEAGSSNLSNSVIDHLRRLAAITKIENEDTVVHTVVAAVRENRQNLTSLTPGNQSPQDWQDYFFREENYYELMFAYYHGKKPLLYKINPAWCIATPAVSHFMTSGIAANLANYILTERTRHKMDSEYAAVVSIKTVEDAIDYVDGCGGPARVAWIRGLADEPITKSPFYLPATKSGMVIIFPQKKVAEISLAISKVESDMKMQEEGQIHRELITALDRMMEEVMRSLMGSSSTGTPDFNLPNLSRLPPQS